MVLFLTSCTQLVSFQLDKVLMTLLVGVLLFHSFVQEKRVPAHSFLALILGLCLTLLSYLINLPDSSLIIFFPVIGLAFVALMGEEKSMLDFFYWALFLHILSGIYLVFSSYLIGINSFVHPMFDKGLPFLHAAKGFTTTVQAFGTLIIGWFLIYYRKKELFSTGFVDEIAFYVALLGLILTFNRNSLLVFYIILFFKHKNIFRLSVVLGFVFYFSFFENINKLLFNVSTITSRVDLLQAFRIAFFEHTDWLGYLLGNGSNFIHQSISRGTLYNTGYIENGTAVLLYTYGFTGYFFYLVFVLVFSGYLFVKNMTFYFAVFFYIFVVGQQFTHEFFSTTVYILLTIFLLIVNSKK